MTVSTCPDCGGKVSTKLSTCPHCGNPNPHGPSVRPEPDATPGSAAQSLEEDFLGQQLEAEPEAAPAPLAQDEPIPAFIRSRRRKVGLVVRLVLMTAGIVGVTVLAALLCSSDKTEDSPGAGGANGPNDVRRVLEETGRRLEIIGSIEEGKTDFVCGKCGPRDVCEVLFEIKAAGRSNPKQRKVIRDYLKDRGYKHIHGYIVSRDSPGVYEAAWLRSTDWGAIPSTKHFVLETTLTEYSSKGRFDLWAIRVNSRDIQLKSGFSDTWDVYREDAFGSVIQRIYSAPAGQQTSKAAENALGGLCEINGEL